MIVNQWELFYRSKEVKIKLSQSKLFSGRERQSRNLLMRRIKQSLARSLRLT